jgi:uncharacterized membrane protein
MASADLTGHAEPVRVTAPVLRDACLDAPWRWLDAGWRDFRAAPGVSLAYGLLAVAGALAIATALFRFAALPLLLPLAGGFFLLGPILAVGLYSVSRSLEQKQTPSIGGSLTVAWRVRGRMALFGIMLFVFYLFWTRTALLLFMLFFGVVEFPPANEFVPTLLLTPHGLGLLITGTAVGGAFAALSYSMSAIAVPFMLDQPVDPVTASVTSIRAVLKNLPAMLLWAVLIVATTIVGLSTLFIGLAIAFPLIAFATWHAYRDLVVQNPAGEA